MIEHIAWRMGLSINLNWESENWNELGKTLGSKIKELPAKASDAISLGMIDNGSAVVSVNMNEHGMTISSVEGIDCEQFKRLRCEQMHSGAPLIALLEGISDSLSAKINIEIWSLKDAHHTWEGVFRGLGIALGKIFAPKNAEQEILSKIALDQTVIEDEKISELTVCKKGSNYAKVMRGTAETGVTVTIDLQAKPQCKLSFNVDESIRAQVAEFEILLRDLMLSLGGNLEIDFTADKLSSGHVFMEDIGLVFGRALLEILKIRMEKYGVNGAGSNLSKITDASDKKVQIGVSVEGRKFWEFVPQDGNFRKLQNQFLLEANVLTALRSEDLDEFFDGLSGGMSASIMVHLRKIVSASDTWQEVFRELGLALRETFEANPYRKGVPPGVKATLA